MPAATARRVVRRHRRELHAAATAGCATGCRPAGRAVRRRPPRAPRAASTGARGAGGKRDARRRDQGRAGHSGRCPRLTGSAAHQATRPMLVPTLRKRASALMSALKANPRASWSVPRCLGLAQYRPSTMATGSTYGRASSRTCWPRSRRRRGTGRGARVGRHVEVEEQEVTVCGCQAAEPARPDRGIAVGRLSVAKVDDDGGKADRVTATHEAANRPARSSAPHIGVPPRLTGSTQTVR